MYNPDLTHSFTQKQNIYIFNISIAQYLVKCFPQKFEM